jgi:hypothetical protein
MSGRLVTIALLLFIAAAITAVAWALWRAGGPLSGAMEHDFGAVTIQGEAASVSHTFTLVNQSGAVLEIDSVRPGCGCAVAEPSVMSLARGASIDVDVTLRLTHAGHKRTHVALFLRDQPLQKLWIAALGVRELGLWPQQKHVRLSQDGPVPLILMAEVLRGDEPPLAPQLEPPAGVRASFDGWERVRPADPDRGTATRWRGRVSLILEGELAPDASITVRLPAVDPATVTVLPPAG